MTDCRNVEIMVGDLVVYNEAHGCPTIGKVLQTPEQDWNNGLMRVLNANHLSSQNLGVYVYRQSNQVYRLTDKEMTQYYLEN